MALVTLEVTLASAAADRSAKLCWLSEDGEEAPYIEVRVGASVRQETFAGHQWILRGCTSQEVLATFTAEPAPAVQQHTVGAGEAAAGGGVPVPDTDEDKDEARGVWLADGGGSRFERCARRAGELHVVWRELDAEGNEAARYEQLEVRCDTRWFWWMETLFTKIFNITGDQQHLLFSALTIAAAYNLDASFVAPPWARDITLKLGLGSNPLVALLLLVIIVGAVVAAALPLTSPTLILRNVSASRTEVRLGSAAGFSREPSNRAGYSNPWDLVSAGSFETTPRDLREACADRRRHILLVSIVTVFFASKLRPLLSTSG